MFRDREQRSLLGFLGYAFQLSNEVVHQFVRCPNPIFPHVTAEEMFREKANVLGLKLPNELLPSLHLANRANPLCVKSNHSCSVALHDYVSSSSFKANTATPR